MKFLCVPCDSPMKLQGVAPPDGGSLSVIYSCPECGYEMAMLTNPYETQIVQSLGVRIGPQPAGGEAGHLRADASASMQGAAAGSRPASESEAGSAEAGGRCPFSAMIQGADDTQRRDVAEPVRVAWTAAAEARLLNVPAFVRPMARAGIERYALENGAAEVNEQVLDAAREFFGM
jgi:hypothetical protein